MVVSMQWLRVPNCSQGPRRGYVGARATHCVLVRSPGAHVPAPRALPRRTLSSDPMHRHSGEFERRTDDIPRDAVTYILNLGRALHACGYAAHRLEQVLGLAAERLGLEAQFFSTPTSIFLSFGPIDRQRVYLLRVEPSEQDLGKLSALDRVTVKVARGEMTPTEGSRQIAVLSAAPSRYGQRATTLAFGLASGAATRFLGGGLREIVAGTILGLIIGVLAALARRYAGIARVFEPLAAFIAAFLATGAGVLIGPLSVFIATLAGIIVLVPGLTLTVAMTELSTQHLLAGTARMSAAFMTFLGITFGVALGNSVGMKFFGQPPLVDPASVPAWGNLLALAVAPLAFTVLLKASPREYPCSCWLARSPSTRAGSAASRSVRSSARSSARWRWES